eukprot:jgi/Mesvir1/2423/Mv22158-RA.1
MACNLGDIAPDFHARTNEGNLHWHDFIKDTWAILFSHPADYTPVCTTELGELARLREDFEKRGVKVAALSCNSVDDHKGWIEDINAYCKAHVWYPIIEDPSRDLAVLYGMVDPNEKDAKGQPVTCRAVFFLGPDKKVKAKILYPASTGRDFHESMSPPCLLDNILPVPAQPPWLAHQILRVVDSLQLAVKYSVATPANWRHGHAVMIQPQISDEDAVHKFPKGFHERWVMSTSQLPDASHMGVT